MIGQEHTSGVDKKIGTRGDMEFDCFLTYRRGVILMISKMQFYNLFYVKEFKTVKLKLNLNKNTESREKYFFGYF